MIPSFATALLNAPSDRLVAWCAVGICAGLYLFFNGFRLLQRKHLILDTPASKIRSASLGMVEFSGLAVGPYVIASPITARSCYFYRTVVWEWKRHGRSSEWVKVAAECVHVPFFLDDNTGKVLVDPRGADLDLHCDFQREFCDSFFTTKEQAPPNVHSFLLRHGISTSNKIKVEEFCIKPKNALFVLGTLAENGGLELASQPIVDDEHDTRPTSEATRLNPLPSVLGQRATANTTGADDTCPRDPSGSESVGESLTGSFSQKSGFNNSPFAESALGKAILEEESGRAAREVIPLSPQDGPKKSSEMTQQQKITAALMKAGISTPAAWAAAGVTEVSPFANVAVSSDGKAPTDGFDLHPQVVLLKGKHNPAFIISWRSQREVARSLGWKCTLMIWGGPALAVLCLYGLLTLLHRM
jgi:hypothetical protein